MQFLLNTLTREKNFLLGRIYSLIPRWKNGFPGNSSDLDSAEIFDAIIKERVKRNVLLDLLKEVGNSPWYSC